MWPHFFIAMSKATSAHQSRPPPSNEQCLLSEKFMLMRSPDKDAYVFKNGPVLLSQLHPRHHQKVWDVIRSWTADKQSQFVREHGPVLLSELGHHGQVHGIVLSWDVDKQQRFVSDHNLENTPMGTHIVSTWPVDVQATFYTANPPPYATKVASVVETVWASFSNGTTPPIVHIGAGRILLMTGYACPLTGDEGNVLVSIGHNVYRHFHGKGGIVRKWFKKIMQEVHACVQLSEVLDALDELAI